MSYFNVDRVHRQAQRVIELRPLADEGGRFVCVEADNHADALRVAGPLDRVLYTQHAWHTCVMLRPGLRRLARHDADVAAALRGVL